MELKFTKKEETKSIAFDGDEVYLARSNKDDDRLLFIRNGKLIFAMNTTNWQMQVNNNLGLYGNLKKVSKLEIKAILEE
jgi:hypothetical protein